MTIQEGEGVPSRATPRAYDSPSYWAARAQEAGTHCLERLPGPHAESATRCFRRRCSSSSCQRRFASSPPRPVFALPRVQRGHAYPHPVEALHTTILPIDSATQPEILQAGGKNSAMGRVYVVNPTVYRPVPLSPSQSRRSSGGAAEYSPQLVVLHHEVRRKMRATGCLWLALTMAAFPVRAQIAEPIQTNSAIPFEPGS